MPPKVSVIMPVFNASKYLATAIESILCQSYEDFEFVIVDDQSTDESRNIIQSYEDTRIRLVSTPKNLGRAGADNYAMQYTNGKYIAKMDSDDISMPKRLEKQVSFLDENSDISIVGAWSRNFGASNYLNKYPEDPESAKCKILCCLPVSNPSIMIRRELFDQGFRYDQDYRQSEDYDFFARYIELLKISSIPEPLIKYRISSAESKNQILEERKTSTASIQMALFKRWGMPFTDNELKLHTHISYYDTEATEEVLNKINNWLIRILDYNRRTPWFDQRYLERFIAEKWFDVCYNLKPKKCRTRKIHKASHLSSKIHLSLLSQAKHIVRDVLN